MKITIEREFRTAQEALAFLRSLEQQTGGPVVADVAPVEKEAPKPRARKAKAEPIAPGTVDGPVETRQETPANDAKVTVEQVQTALEAVFGSQGMQTARDLLSRYGVQRVRDLKEDRYAEFVEQAQRVAAGEKV